MLLSTSGLSSFSAEDWSFAIYKNLKQLLGTKKHFIHFYRHVVENDFL